MIRATLDANVIVGAFPSLEGTLAAVRQAWREQRFTLVISEHILAEVTAAWDDSYWQRRIAAEVGQEFLRLLRTDAVTVPLTAYVSGVASHPEDDLVLATAASGEVNYLVTGDHELLALHRYQNVQIVSPRRFLEILDDEKLGG